MAREATVLSGKLGERKMLLNSIHVLTIYSSMQRGVLPRRDDRARQRGRGHSNARNTGYSTSIVILAQECFASCLMTAELCQ
jgi:hypothetical protein